MSVAPTYRDNAYPARGDGVIADDRRTLMLNRISWGAILAGVVAALVIQIVLNILGIGIGASSLSAVNTGDNPSGSGLSMTAGIWWVVSGILASFFGGIVAGRLCGAGSANTARWHGFVSWATTTLVIFVLLTSAVGNIVGGTFNALGSTLSGAGKAATSAIGGAAQATDGDALQAQVRRLVKPDDAQNVQDDVVGYIRSSVTGGDQKAIDSSRDRAVNSLAKAANISPDEAKSRLGEAETKYHQAVDQAKQTATQAAEATRKGLATAGLFGSLVLLLGALAGWLGGGVGTPQAYLVRD